MANGTGKFRIVHCEDGSWGPRLHDMFENGFGDKVEFELRPNFSKLKEEIASGKLGEAYILDNEITEDDQVQGGKMAQLIYDKAQELGRDVIIISLLCSNPEGVRKKYGDELDTRGIPILNKTFQALFAAFYIGRCLTKGKIGFSQWLTEEGLVLPINDEGSKNLTAMLYISGPAENERYEGSFMQPMRDYLARVRDTVSRFEGVVEVLDTICPEARSRRPEQE